jgi:predicted HicB family RNase H-like nuclease
MDTPNPSQRETMTTRLHPDIKQALKIQAATQRCSLADVLEQAALYYLKSLKSAS